MRKTFLPIQICRLATVTLLIFSIASIRAGTVAYWNMTPTGISSPSVLDGQINEAVQNLWAVNGSGNVFATSSDVPPAAMRTRADDNGMSYNASTITNVDGALLYPFSAYGDVFRFTNAFTVELFFKTFAAKSTNGD